MSVWRSDSAGASEVRRHEFCQHDITAVTVTAVAAVTAATEAGRFKKPKLGRSLLPKTVRRLPPEPAGRVSEGICLVLGLEATG